MLLSKLISFDSLDAQNSEDLKRKLYNFFFNWSKDLGNAYGLSGYDDMTTTNK
jgi:hypothetical protein